jgi:chloramphenicol O-acetyltransferase type A
MIKKVTNFKRKELFEHYNECDNPFIIITVPVDVTNIVNYCKIHKNFYATMGYYVTKTVNEIDNFRYRLKNNKIYFCDEVKSNYVQMHKDGEIGYFTLPIVHDYQEYIKTFNEVQNNFLNNNYECVNDIDEIWLSCEPWVPFNGLIPPFSKKNTIPQFIWDKYKQVDDKYFVNLMILVHHGFADGSHIANFIKKLEDNIKNVVK